MPPSPTVTRPALRYHGGKFRLAPWILQFFPPHRAYVEPFGGAASLLLLKQPVAAECYNDLDDRIVGFFRVLRDPEQSLELERRLRLTLYARAELEWSYGPPADPVDAAHRLVVRSFMGHGSDSATRSSRTGFRARLSDGRALPSAEWADWPDAMAAMRDRLRTVLIENDDALRVIDRMDASGTLIYCDPPYVLSTRSGAASSRSSTTNGYRHEMTDAEHEALASRLHECAGMVLVSGYPCDLYARLYRGWQTFRCSHVADRARMRTEVVWLNPACSAALERSRGSLFSCEAA
jgi:DNA adenine methylase